MERRQTNGLIRVFLRRVSLLRCVAVSALAATAACGAQASREDAKRPPLLVFGAALSFTGREAREGRLTQEGYEFWKDYINAHGGLSVGHRAYLVQIKYYDDTTSPQTAARLVEKLIDSDRVNFILGPYGSSSSLSAAAVVERKKIPMVEGNGAAENTFNRGFHYTFGVLSPARRYLEGVVDMAVHQMPRPSTLAITAADDPFSLEVQQGAIAFASSHGLKIVYSAKYPLGTTDVTGIVSAIHASKPDIVLNAGHLEDALVVQRALKEQDVLAKAYGYSVGADTPDFPESLSKDANFVFGGAQWSTTARYHGVRGFYADSFDYTAAFMKRYGHAPDYHNASATAACLAFQYAIGNAGSLEPGKVRDSLGNLAVETFYGLLKFDSRGLNVYKPMVTNQIQEGKLVTVWPPNLAAGRARYPAPPWAMR